MALLPLSQGARELGCSVEHARRQVRAGRWPAYKLGPKALRIDPEEIRALGKRIHEGERESQAVKEGS